MCREPAWGALPVAKVMRKEARHTQRRDRASGVSLDIFENIFNSFKIICIRSWHSLVSLLPVSGKSTIFSTFLFEKISLLPTPLYPTYFLKGGGGLRHPEWGLSYPKTAELGAYLTGSLVRVPLTRDQPWLDQGFPWEYGIGEKDRNKERDKERILQLRK